MKIIQVHVHDGDLTSTVSNLLNQGFTISVDLDVLDDGPTAVEAREQLDAELKREHRAMRKARRINQPEWGVPVADGWHEVLNPLESTSALTVECRSCGAIIGERCFRPDRTPHPTYIHVDRVRDHRTAAGH